jgi:transcriptional regulator with XRE-family HTH domain
VVGEGNVAVRHRTVEVGNRIRRSEFQKQIPHRKFVAALEIDTPMYSKIEHGSRRAEREQITVIAQLLQIDENTLAMLWLTDKIIVAIGDGKIVLLTIY